MATDPIRAALARLVGGRDWRDLCHENAVQRVELDRLRDQVAQGDDALAECSGRLRAMARRATYRGKRLDSTLRQYAEACIAKSNLETELADLRCDYLEHVLVPPLEAENARLRAELADLRRAAAESREGQGDGRPEHPGLIAGVVNVLRGEHAAAVGSTGLTPFHRLPADVRERWTATAEAVVRAVRRGDSGGRAERAGGDTMTFLDLVRAVGDIARVRCHEECDPGLHRQEAANYLGVLIENPGLLRALARKADSAPPDRKAILDGLARHAAEHGPGEAATEPTWQAAERPERPLGEFVYNELDEVGRTAPRPELFEGEPPKRPRKVTDVPAPDLLGQLRQSLAPAPERRPACGHTEHGWWPDHREGRWGRVQQDGLDRWEPCPEPTTETEGGDGA